ncbi:unnamed protein product [Protopolystoma xenopodis]|uniref:Uncharacterized protein n=1 Tax=Protopolystoma xenopodis TaxID=117903 RepID=A0A448X2L5_9PLAT|nr:unnamed protein product [Protopolystoma xenopodis]
MWPGAQRSNSPETGYSVNQGPKCSPPGRKSEVVGSTTDSVPVPRVARAFASEWPMHHWSEVAALCGLGEMSVATGAIAGADRVAIFGVTVTCSPVCRLALFRRTKSAPASR